MTTVAEIVAQALTVVQQQPLTEECVGAAGNEPPSWDAAAFGPGPGVSRCYLQWPSAAPPVTPEMIEAGRETFWNGPARGAGICESLAAVYRAMRALEPMRVTPSLWSDDSYRALLAERDVLRDEVERLKEVMCVASQLQKPVAGMGPPAMEPPRDPLGPHLSALRGLP